MRLIDMTHDEGNRFYGTVKVGERGQIVIPKKAREDYDIKAGDSLLVYSDHSKLIKIIKEKVVRDKAIRILENLDKKD
jgi:AbrB family looped-hinge helix DNA binding protein